MKKEINVKTVKSIVYTVYLLTFFIPIYNTTILGVVYKSSIYSLQAGVFFIIFFFIVIASTIIIQYLKEEWTKLSFLISSSVMFLFLLILVFLKSSIYSMSIAFYIQLMLIVYLFFLQFMEVKALLLLQKIGEYSVKMYHFIGEKINKFVQNRKDKSSSKENIEINDSGEQENEKTN